MKQSRSAIILYLEPKRVADWDEAMRESVQLYSGRVYAIRLLHTLFHSEKPLTDDRIKIIRETINDYPDLTDEVKQRFPAIFN